MLQIVNRTRLAAGLALFLDPWGRELVTVVAKGTFTMPLAGEEPEPAEEQVAPWPADVHHGEPARSSIRYPADLVPGKRGTDVLLVGSARAPRGRPVHRLEVSVRVGALARTVVVTGDRHWEARAMGTGFAMTPPAPFAEMPLIYERAFGGGDPTPGDGGAAAPWDERNPVGTGFRTRAEGVAGTPVPNLEDRDHLIADWRDKPPVAGLGALDAAWEPRRRFAGTYDRAWAETQAPLLPTDFDVRFFNVAPPGLAATEFLRTRVPVELTNVAGVERLAFELPIPDVRLAFRIGDRVTEQAARLWTVLLEPDAGRCVLSWGSTFAVGKQPSRAYAVELTVDGALRRSLALDTDGART